MAALPPGKMVRQSADLLPRTGAGRLVQTVGVDRLGALHLAIEPVRRGGTIPVSGVYGGMSRPRSRRRAVPLRPVYG
ncbi:hypothetical protein [Streptomyces sp. NPDC001070]